MTRDQREQSYKEFKSHYRVDHPTSVVEWDDFEVVDALWSLYSYCLGKMGEDGFWLFLDHLAYVSDPKNRVDTDMITTISSMSEQGRSMSFQVADQSKILNNKWLSLSPAGNKILLLLERCNAKVSGGFTARMVGGFFC